MNKEEFLETISRGFKERWFLDQLLRELELPARILNFEGRCLKKVIGLSRFYEDRVVNEKSQTLFRRSMKRPGDMLESNDARWVVVWNEFARGDAGKPDTHTLILVPMEAIERLGKPKPFSPPPRVGCGIRL